MHPSILSLILGGGRGTRLYPLTKSRSKPAVPVGGKYRLIDIPISNCINSGVNQIYVLTQFLSASLHRHIANTYKFDMFSRGFVEILAAQQTNEDASWYQGTADAVRQNIRYFESPEFEHVLILSGDQLYRMNYQHFLKTHLDTKADATLAMLPVNREACDGFGLIQVDSNGRICGFVEKPTTDEAVAPFHTPDEWIAKQGIEPNGRNYLASMGIYLFKRQVLLDVLKAEPRVTDFGKEVFPRSYRDLKFQAHLFDGYWEDLGTIKSYHESSLVLGDDNPPFEFNSPEGVIYTRMRSLPASRIQNATLIRSVVSDGCVILGGTTIDHCMIGVRSRIGRDVKLRDAVLIGADTMETDADRARNAEKGVPDLTIGDGCVIERAIIDKDCRIGAGCKIVNEKGIDNLDADNYCIREGLVVVPRGSIIAAGTVI